MQLSKNIPGLEGGKYNGIMDRRSPQMVRREIQSRTEGVNSLVRFFYLKDQLTVSFWERTRQSQPLEGRFLEEYEEAVGQIWTKFQQQCTGTLMTESILRKWNSLKQFKDERIDVFLSRVRTLIEERALVGSPASLAETIIVLKLGMTNPAALS
jgi:hypothetical protein